MAEFLSEGQGLLDAELRANAENANDDTYTFMVISLAWLMLAALAIGIDLQGYMNYCMTYSTYNLIKFINQYEKNPSFKQSKSSEVI